MEPKPRKPDQAFRECISAQQISPAPRPPTAEPRPDRHPAHEQRQHQRLRVGRVPEKEFQVVAPDRLVYESIWSHYLKLFLGHAAYAQTLVLALFMGGMAIGSWFCSRWSGGWGNLLRGYALAEGLIGLAGLAFHPIFVTATETAYESVLPALGGETSAALFKWALAGLLILPQSILLGTTFPLMSAGLI